MIEDKEIIKAVKEGIIQIEKDYKNNDEIKSKTKVQKEILDKLEKEISEHENN